MMQMWFERGERGEGFAFGVSERLFIPRHEKAPVHVGKVIAVGFVVRVQDVAEVGGAGFVMRQQAVFHIAIFHPNAGLAFVVLIRFVFVAHGSELTARCGTANLNTHWLLCGYFVSIAWGESAKVTKSRKAHKSQVENFQKTHERIG